MDRFLILLIIASLIALSQSKDPANPWLRHAKEEKGHSQNQGKPAKLIAEVVTEDENCIVSFFVNKEEEEVAITMECDDERETADEEDVFNNRRMKADNQENKDETRGLVGLYDRLTKGKEKAPDELVEADGLLKKWLKKKRYSDDEYIPPPVDELDGSLEDDQRDNDNRRLSGSWFDDHYCVNLCYDWDACMLYRTCSSDYCWGKQFKGVSFLNKAYVYRTRSGSSGIQVEIEHWVCDFWIFGCRWERAVDPKWQSIGDLPKLVSVYGSDRDRRSVFRVADGDGFHFYNYGELPSSGAVEIDECTLSEIGQESQH